MKSESDVSTETKQSQELRVISFRAPAIVQRQIDALQATWGENITHVIHRAIAIAHERECVKRRS